MLNTFNKEKKTNKQTKKQTNKKNACMEITLCRPKTYSLTKSKIFLACVDGFLYFLTNYKQDHRLETAIKLDSQV